MRHTQARAGAPAAFTLVELLVVITIISVLVALAVVGVMGAFSQGTLATTKVEIDQLVAALNLVKNDYQIKYLPSRLVLRRDNNYNTNDPVYGAEYARTTKFLQQMFGSKINLTPVPLGNKDPNQGIDWSNEGVPVQPQPTGGSDGKGNYILYGDQALVFFLGGIPAPVGGTNGCLGFATNPQNPADKASLATGSKKGPYFDFVPSRLVRGGNGFFSYLDQWKTNSPYLYFSTYGSENSYHLPGTEKLFPAGDCTPALKDPSGNPVVVAPYLESMTPPIRFTNSTSFQIISAGKDGVFGQGGLWDPSKGLPLSNGNKPGVNPGVDDQANFSGNLLGKAK
jgi:prepilin-type N-terminal cleavage/methylation domain-containing protein